MRTPSWTSRRRSERWGVQLLRMSRRCWSERQADLATELWEGAGEGCVAGAQTVPAPRKHEGGGEAQEAQRAEAVHG